MKVPDIPLRVSMGTQVLLVLPALQMLTAEQSIPAMPRMAENYPYPSHGSVEKSAPIPPAAGRGHNPVQQVYHHTGSRLIPVLHKAVDPAGNVLWH